MLGDLGSWGSNFLDQASSTAAAASSLATSGLDKGTEFLKKGTKAVKASLKENVGAATFQGQSHTVEDPRSRTTRRVTEVQFLAEGAFGAVMKVTDNTSGEAFALKKIRCQEGVQVASSLAAAEMEAKLLTSIPAHPNIIKCFGFSVDKHASGTQTVKVLMELCSGGHLLDFMDQRGGNLSAKEVLEIFVQITSSVHHLHSLTPPIQHRDLKVENVLRGSKGQWVLCDFGSCSTVEVPPQEFSRPDLLRMQEEIDKTVTMLYRPPEMADIQLNFRKGYKICSQVDIWMLGCILYTLAFYRHPFQDNATAMAIINAKYFIPSDHRLAQSKKLCGFIHWLLAADPKDRPTTGKILELVPKLGPLKYEELLASLPQAVRDKINKLDMYSARKDTGDLELPSDLSSAVVVAQAIAKDGPGQAQALKRASTTPAVASPPPAAGQGGGDFDLAFALAPSTASSAQPAAPGPTQSPPRGQLHRHGSAPASAPADLLSLGTPPLAPSQPPAAAGGGGAMGDLLDFCTAPTQQAAPKAFAAPTGAQATLPIEHRGQSDWSADFGSFGQPLATASPSPMTASLSSASARAAGYPNSASPSPGTGTSWADGGGGASNQFASFASSAASPTASSPSPAVSSLAFATRAAAPAAAAGGGDAFCDFADFASALAPPVQASSTAPAPAQQPATADRSPAPDLGNLLDF